MIERHYFKGSLLRSYDFNFGFVIPSSTNSWEAIYPIPSLTGAPTYSAISQTFLAIAQSLQHSPAVGLKECRQR